MSRTASLANQRSEPLAAPPWAGSFLVRLPDEARSELLGDATVFDVRAGRLISDQTDLNRRTVVLMAGLATATLRARDGRRIVVRYIHPGALIGTVPGAPPLHHHLHVEAVSDCSLIELPQRALVGLLERDARVAGAMLADVSERLQDTYATLAVTAFGTMRERVSLRLLTLATRLPDGRLVAPMTQQELADAVGTVRQVAARILAELRQLGVVATRPGEIEIRDEIGLAALVERWV